MTALAAFAVVAAALLAAAPAASAQHHDHAPQPKPAARKPAAKKPAARKAAARKPAPAAATAAQAADAKYVCPMHPEVVSATEGTCPKCKMRLREKVAPAAAPAQAAPAPAAGAKMNIPDVELLDQDGNKVKFYTDLVKGKTVAVNFIFTTCTTICPPLGATFMRVQRELGERAGRDVHFISISVDPVTDTPERLKAWGAKFKAGKGWTFVTGPKAAVDELLRALAASSARPEDHSPMTLVGNDASGQWTRTYGLAPPSQLIKIINDAAAGKLDSSASATAGRE